MIRNSLFAGHLAFAHKKARLAEAEAGLRNSQVGLIIRDLSRRG